MFLSLFTCFKRCNIFSYLTLLCSVGFFIFWFQLTEHPNILCIRVLTHSFFYLSSGLIECSCALLVFFSAVTFTAHCMSLPVAVCTLQMNTAHWQNMNRHFFLLRSFHHCVYELVLSANIHCHFMAFLRTGSLKP